MVFNIGFFSRCVGVLLRAKERGKGRVLAARVKDIGKLLHVAKDIRTSLLFRT